MFVVLLKLEVPLVVGVALLSFAARFRRERVTGVED